MKKNIFYFFILVNLLPITSQAMTSEEEKIVINNLTLTAQQGNPHAQFMLGLSYLHGTWVNKNPTEALKWLTKASQQNQGSAQAYLGSMYYEGINVDVNYDIAKDLYTKALSNGSSDVYYFLGHWFLDGRAVKKDFQEAKYWYGLSCRSGDIINRDYACKLLSQL